MQRHLPVLSDIYKDFLALFFIFFLCKGNDRADAANAEACVLCREDDVVQILCLRRSEAETQMSENKNSPEKRRQILLSFQLCTMKMYFVRARVFNWLPVLTSLDIYIFFSFAFALNSRTAAVITMTSYLQSRTEKLSCFNFLNYMLLLIYFE